MVLAKIELLLMGKGGNGSTEPIWPIFRLAIFVGKYKQHAIPKSESEFPVENSSCGFSNVKKAVLF